MFTCKLLFPLGGLAIILRWQTWPVGNSMNLRPQLQDWLPLCEKLQSIWSCDISREIRTLITQYLRWEIVFQACPTYKIEYSFFTFNCFDRWFTRLKTGATVQRVKEAIQVLFRFIKLLSWGNLSKATANLAFVVSPMLSSAKNRVKTILIHSPEA